MNPRRALNIKRRRRAMRNRAGVSGGVSHPRLAVSRSNCFIYAQLIDDEKGRTLAHASSRELKAGKKTKSEAARLTGELLARRAAEIGIKKAVFDRRAYKYHGRVRELAEGAKGGGLGI